MKHVFPREFYVPKGAIKVADKNSDAVAYVYEGKRAAGAGGKPFYGVVVFAGKAQKPVSHYSYGTAEKRNQYVAGFFEGRKQHAERVAKDRAERSKPHTYQVGDILVSSWGYEQTNIDFYQVTAVTPSTLKLRALKQERDATGWERGTCMPIRDAFIGEKETTHRVSGGNSVRVKGNYGYAHKWDGKPENWTSYH
jgi:hypothetical protein